MRHRPRRILQDRVRRSSVGRQKDVIHQPMIKGATARSARGQPKPKSVLTRPRRSHRHRGPTPPLRISPACPAPHHVPGTVCRIPKIHPKRIVRLRGVAQTTGLKEKSQDHIVPGPQIQIGRSQYVGERIGTQRSRFVGTAVGIDAVEHRLAHTAGLNRPCRSYLNFLVRPFPWGIAGEIVRKWQRQRICGQGLGRTNTGGSAAQNRTFNRRKPHGHPQLLHRLGRQTSG